MQPFEQIKEYCNQVNEQIRWKKAKPSIAAEIENHLCDQRDAYISSGDNETDATQKALLQMGDAVLVGQELDKAHRPKPQWFMIALTGFLMLIGLSVNHWISTTTDSLHSCSILPLVFALFVYSMRNKGICGILVCGVAYFPLAAILLVIPSMSGLILYTISSLSVLCFSVCRGWFGFRSIATVYFLREYGFIYRFRPNRIYAFRISDRRDS